MNHSQTHIIKSGKPDFLFGLLCLALFVITFNAFRPALLFDFIWDDSLAIVANSNIHGLTLDNLRWALTSQFAGHYQPLTWFTLMLDYELWGLDSFGFHLTNIIVHSINAILLYTCVLSFQDIYNTRFPVTGKNFTSSAYKSRIALVCSFLCVLFYSVHPLRVETVAWVTERRDVLSIFFILISFLFYIRYIQAKPGKGLNANYTYCLLAFFLSLSCKAWAITYPVVLILVDTLLDSELRPLKNQLTGSLRDKIPFILLSLLFAILAYTAQSGAGAVISWEKMGLTERLLQSAHGFNMYLLKTIYPFNLSPLYSLAKTNFFQPYFYIHFLAALTLFVACTALFKKSRLPFLVFMLYLVLISPVIGISQAGPQHMADRYSYFALMTLSFVLATWSSRIFAHRQSLTGYVTGTTYVFFIIAMGLTTMLMFRTSEQIQIWKNEETLWTHAVKVDPDNFQAFINRGEFRARNGFCKPAIEDYNSAIAMDQDNAYALNGRAHCLLVTGANEAALNDLDLAIEIYPRYVNAWFNRAVVLNNLGYQEKAIGNFEKVLSLIAEYDEGNSYARNTNYYLGMIYLSEQNSQKARTYFSRMLELDVGNSSALFHRAQTYLMDNNNEAARLDLQQALTYLQADSGLYKQTTALLAELSRSNAP